MSDRCNAHCSACVYSCKWYGCMLLIKDMHVWTGATPTNIWARDRLLASTEHNYDLAVACQACLR